jgi:hypothetical protein
MGVISCAFTSPKVPKDNKISRIKTEWLLVASPFIELNRLLLLMMNKTKSERCEMFFAIGQTRVSDLELRDESSLRDEL